MRPNLKRKGEVGLADRPRFTVDQLLDRLKLRWQLQGKASSQNLSVLKKAKEDFGTKMADELTTQDLERYALRRSIKVEVKKKHISRGWNFSCFAAHLMERDLF
jgi:hypothetical protein